LFHAVLSICLSTDSSDTTQEPLREAVLRNRNIAPQLRLPVSVTGALPEDKLVGKTLKTKEKTRVVAYIRTSSAANVGADKDSEKRQRAAIEGFAKRAGFALMHEFSEFQVPTPSKRALGSLRSWTRSKATACVSS
jgi:hypothetical protein